MYIGTVYEGRNDNVDTNTFLEKIIPGSSHGERKKMGTAQRSL